MQKWDEVRGNYFRLKEPTYGGIKILALIFLSLKKGNAYLTAIDQKISYLLVRMPSLGKVETIIKIHIKFW